MKRAVIIAVSAAMFTSLFAGFAAASPVSGEIAGQDTGSVVRTEDGGEVDERGLWSRCRKLAGDDELTSAAHERCVQAFKRWCRSHPRARHCRPVPTPPRCRIIDPVTDRRCLPDPCRITDRAVTLRCPPPECPTAEPVVDRWCRPDPCRVADRVAGLCIPPPCPATDVVDDRRCLPYPCVSEGEIVKCVPIPPELPMDLPVDRPASGPADRPADVRPGKDRILDRQVDRQTDRTGNDVHVLVVVADS